MRREAHGPNNLSGPSRLHPQHPSSELPSHSRAGCHGTSFPLARGPRAPSGEFPPRSRATRPSGEFLPRSRAMRPLGRISASLEGYAPPRPNLRLARGFRGACNPRAHSPDRSIKCSDTPRSPGSKANARHAGPLTPPGNHIPALFHQPSP
jgi:hypothetical protein